MRYESLDSDVTTEDRRVDAAVQRSREIGARALEIDRGADPLHGSDLVQAIAAYHKAAEVELRDKTVALYKRATDMFLEWARAHGIKSTRDLKAARLPGFRDYLLAQRKKAYVRGGKRGQRKAGNEKLSPQTINWQLRAVKTALNHLRSRGMVPLTSDDIADRLKPVEVPQDDPEFLRPQECVALLEAALRHDAETFAETRSEHRGIGTAGTTPKYDPIAPLVATVLLGGFRIGEALAVRWSAVDLAVLDSEGKPKGEIRLKASETKTKRARTVELGVSPSLRILLATMKLRAGDAQFVFGGDGPMPRSSAEAARRRLVGEVPKKARKIEPKKNRKQTPAVDFGAPRNFTWQALRSTCATYQCNAPSIFGDAAAFRSAKRLGHSITVSEKLYANQFSVSHAARTLEQAMGIEAIMARVIESASGYRVPAPPLRAVAAE
ncbi:MAG: hypothetical protein QM778_35240 [Myxococcales bacterium]